MFWFKKKNQKAQIIIIHGFAQGVRSSLFKRLKINFLNYFERDFGFKAFKSLIKKQKAKIFLWRENLDIPINKYFDIKTYISLYKAEKTKAISNEIQEKLNNFINENDPEIIICHSMGCYLFLNFIEKFELNESVKVVFLVQGDFDKKYKINNPKIIQRINQNQIKFINCYCPWDQALITSPIVNKFVIPAGLGKTNNPQFEDKFFPLYKSFNLHESSIRDKDFYKFVIANSKNSK